MVRDKSNNTLITEIKDELTELERRSTSSGGSPSDSNPTMKSAVSYIGFAVMLIGSTWALMNYLFVSQKDFSKYQSDTRVATVEWRGSTASFLRTLDKDVQKNNNLVIVIIRKQNKLDSDLVRVLERLRIPVVRTMDKVDAHSGSKSVSRVPAELFKKEK